MESREDIDPTVIQDSDFDLDWGSDCGPLGLEHGFDSGFCHGHWRRWDGGIDSRRPGRRQTWDHWAGVRLPREVIAPLHIDRGRPPARYPADPEVAASSPGFGIETHPEASRRVSLLATSENVIWPM